MLYEKILDYFGDATSQPAILLHTPTEALRQLGLSNQKAQYLKNVAQFWMDNNLRDARWHDMHEDAIIDLLTQIKVLGAGLLKWCSFLIWHVMMFFLLMTWECAMVWHIFITSVLMQKASNDGRLNNLPNGHPTEVGVADLCGRLTITVQNKMIHGPKGRG